MTSVTYGHRQPAPLGELADGSAWRRGLAYLFGVCVLLLASGADPWASRTLREDVPELDAADSSDMVAEGDLARRAGLLCLGAVSIAYLASGAGRPVSAMGVPAAAIMAFLAYSGFSVAWSADPALSLRRLIALGMLSAGALAAAKAFSWRQITRFAVLAGGVFLAGGLLCELALGTFTPLAAGYRHAGLAHPNLQAGNCAVVLLGLVAVLGDSRRRKLLWTMIAASAALLLLTRSRGCVASTAVALLAYGWLRSSRYGKLIAAVAAAFTVSLLLLVLGDVLLAHGRDWLLLGRADDDPGSLSGRVSLWTTCMELLADRPLLGYGFEAFWNPDHLLEISRREGWNVPNSHNGFLDLALCVGVSGAALLVLAVGAAFSRAVRRYRALRAPEYAFAAAVLVYFLGANVLGSRMFYPCLQTFIFYVLLAKLAFQPADAWGEGSAGEIDFPAPPKVFRFS